MVHSRRANLFQAGLFCVAIALGLAPIRDALAATAGGSIAVTSDYIYRGFSETNGKPALQLDLHASTNAGTFIGVWGSTRDHNVAPRADYDVDFYLGQRFVLNSAWNTTISATDHAYVSGYQRHSNDYQEISAAVSYLDRWTLSLTAIPNAVRYSEYRLTGRYPAYVADTSGQWLIAKGFYITGGLGYYFVTGPGAYPDAADIGYAYGNAGLAYAWGSWRLDAGYFVTQSKAHHLFPYPLADRHFAGTLSWRF